MEQPHSFGYWVRRRRKALDLTQAALAEQVGCVLVTIKKIEQDVRRPSRLLAERLADALALTPAERAPFLQAARGLAALDDLPGHAERPLAAPLERPPPGPIQVWLFTDIAGSTRLWQEHPGQMGAALAHHDGLLRAAVAAAGGQVFKTVGDAFCVAFLDPAPALEAALAAQRALQAADWALFGLPADALRVRTALHIGSAAPRDGDFFGPPLNHVARLLGVGHGGQVLLSAALAALAADQLPPGAILRDLGLHQLKDLPEPERLAQLVVADLPDAFPPLRTAGALVGNLPPPAVALLGRDAAVAALGERLGAGARLLTITGPGGAGKTTLALAAAATVRPAFPDGLWFADLSPLRQAEQVGPALAQALGLPAHGDPLAAVQAAFGARRALLVIDNFEQVAAAAPLVGELLALAPELAVLVTSRVPLRLRAEQEVPLPPLALPAPGASLAELEQSPAVQLFVARARAVQPAFALSAASAPAVAELCRRLDGLPLALELAAARVRLLPVEALLKRLSLALLRGGAADGPGRHQTLHATIAWSEQLLRPGERRLFARLGLLVGGASLDGVDALGDAGTGEPLEALEGLVSHSLVLAQAGPDGEPRYTMLETIRAFALERLAASGDEAPARRQLLAYLTRLAEIVAPQLQGPSYASAFAQLSAEWPNIAPALEWAVAHEPGAALRLLLVFGYSNILHAEIFDGAQQRRWIEAALANGAATLPEELRIRGSILRGWLWDGDMSVERALGERAIAAARALGHQPLLAEALALTAVRAGSPEKARARGGEAMLAEALTIARQCDDPLLLASVLNSQGVLLLGDHTRYEDCVAAHKEALALFLKLGQNSRAIEVLINLGSLARQQHDFAAARGWYGQGLALTRRLGKGDFLPFLLVNLVPTLLRLGQLDEARTGAVEALLRLRDYPEHWQTHGFALDAMAGVLAATGGAARAARLLGATDAYFETIQLTRELEDLDEYQHTASRARAALGDEAFTLAYAGGKLLDLDGAIGEALGLARTV